MKHLFLWLLILFFLDNTLHSQNLDSIKFRKAESLYNQSKVDSALTLYLELSAEVEKGNINPYTQIAMGNVSHIYYSNRSKKAYPWLKKIINSPLNDSLDTNSLIDPMTNFKHKASLRLFSIEESFSEDSLALSYLNDAFDKYPYYGFPGSCTNVYKHDAYISRLKYQFLLRLDEEYEAIEFGLSSILSAGADGAGFRYHIAAVLEYLKTKHSSKIIQSEWNKSLDQLEVTPENNYKLQYLGYEILIKPRKTYFANAVERCLKYYNLPKKEMQEYLKSHPFSKSIFDIKKFLKEIKKEKKYQD